MSYVPIPYETIRAIHKCKGAHCHLSFAREDNLCLAFTDVLFNQTVEVPVKRISPINPFRPNQNTDSFNVEGISDDQDHSGLVKMIYEAFPFIDPSDRVFMEYMVYDTWLDQDYLGDLAFLSVSLTAFNGLFGKVWCDTARCTFNRINKNTKGLSDGPSS